VAFQRRAGRLNVYAGDFDADEEQSAVRASRALQASLAGLER
jgi:hypothetical protein